MGNCVGKEERRNVAAKYQHSSGPSTSQMGGQPYMRNGQPANMHNLGQQIANQAALNHSHGHGDISTSSTARMMPSGSFITNHSNVSPYPNQGGTPNAQRRNNHSFSSNNGGSRGTPVTGKKPSIGGLPATGDDVVLMALYAYDSRAEGDLSFGKDDHMVLLDDTNSDWWYVRHTKNNERGYVPRNFVARMESAESEEWYAGKIARNQAERLVESMNLPRGTFLIREREQDNGLQQYALTIRDLDESNRGSVKHYKIKRLDDGGFYITTRRTFASIRALVEYYSNVSDGLCHNLVFPAPRIAPTRLDLSHKTAKNWEIERSELELKRLLGTGNFGEVWFGMWRGVVEVAIKTMKQGAMSKKAFLDEAEIMKKCHHPNLVRLYAVCTQEEPFYIVTEYMQNGSLLSYLRGPEGPNLTPSAIIEFAAMIANGMSYLEDRKMVHRDLAARNVLVSAKISGVPQVKVCDFGLARVLMEEDIYEAQTGTKFPIKWTAPEAALNGNFTVKSDVWSYGVLLYEIISRGQTPYPGMQNREVIEQVQIGYRMSQPPGAMPKVYQIMLNCWDKMPEKRPTFEWLHSFFSDYFVSAQPNYQAQSE